MIWTVASVQLVVAAGPGVVLEVAPQVVGSPTPAKDVVTVLADQPVRACVPVDGVVAALAADVIIPAQSQDHVVTAAGDDDVALLGSPDLVAAVGSDDGRGVWPAAAFGRLPPRVRHLEHGCHGAQRKKQGGARDETCAHARGHRCH